jgi:hypothetical protein
MFISSKIDDLDANTKGISLFSWHQHLKPTHGLQAIPKKIHSYRTQRKI